MTRRISSAILLVLGVLGVIGCVAVVLVSWSMASRLNRATDSLFGGFESAFSTAQQQVSRAGDRVEDLKLNAESINAGLKDWGANEVTTRVSSRLRVEESVGRLDSGLEQTDQWLEVMESSVQVVHQAMESGRLLGIPVKVDAVKRLLEEVTAVRVALSNIREPVAAIGEQVSQLGEEKSEPDQVGAMIRLSARLIATFGSIGTRLESFSKMLAEADTAVRTAGTTVRSWIRLAAAVVTLLACWMAAGQGSLIYLGTRGLQRSRTPANQEESPANSPR